MAYARKEVLRLNKHKILIDTHEIEIHREKHKLTPKEMEVLLMLVKNKGRTLSRSEFLEEVWGDEFGKDMGLTQAVSKLRSILGDKDRKTIRTIPKKGYQLVSEEKPSPKFFRPWVVAAIFIFLLISGFVIFKPIGIKVQLREVKKERVQEGDKLKKETTVLFNTRQE